MAEPKRCWRCVFADPAPERAVVRCNWSFGNMPVELPDWAWTAINRAETEVHASVAETCDAYRENDAWQAQLDNFKKRWADARGPVKETLE